VNEQQTLFSMNAVPYLFMAQAKGLTNNAGILQTMNLSTPDGKIKVSIDPALLHAAKFPIAVDDGVLVSLMFVKATASIVEDQPAGLMLPDKRLVKP
jgi:hypothetical protein